MPFNCAIRIDECREREEESDIRAGDTELKHTEKEYFMRWRCEQNVKQIYNPFHYDGAGVCAYNFNVTFIILIFRIQCNACNN